MKSNNQRRMNGKKAQIEMGETIFVVIIIIVLIVLGIKFMGTEQGKSIEKKVDKFKELDAIVVAQLTTSLPEVSCSYSGVRSSSCFDTTKVAAFEKLLTNDSDLVMEYYYEQLGNVNITIEQVYPPGESWELYINKYSETGQNYGKPMMIPVALENPITHESGFGVLYITQFRR